MSQVKLKRLINEKCVTSGWYSAKQLIKSTKTEKWFIQHVTTMILFIHFDFYPFHMFFVTLSNYHDPSDLICIVDAWLPSSYSVYFLCLFCVLWLICAAAIIVRTLLYSFSFSLSTNSIKFQNQSYFLTSWPRLQHWAQAHSFLLKI